MYKYRKVGIGGRSVSLVSSTGSWIIWFVKRLIFVTAIFPLILSWCKTVFGYIFLAVKLKKL
ncbi:hypothetical protein LCGC14_1553890 [marine sediment metagenome]|uniref:Uncharacterized protein n=1 Tax=marine sediment metagenome TaxID=412755 RepID=A0A0F9L5Q7_9ZZZZ